MGKKIYLTESELQRIVENATLEVLNENQQNEFLGTALALGGLAAGAGLYGKYKQRGYHPLKNAYRWAKSAINGTDYEREVKNPGFPKDKIKEIQGVYFDGNMYQDGENIVVGKWGPAEQRIYDRIKSIEAKAKQNDAKKESAKQLQQNTNSKYSYDPYSEGNDKFKDLEEGKNKQKNHKK